MVTKNEALNRLASARLFSGLGQTDLRHIHDITKVVHHHAGHHIITEGDRGSGFQMIMAGEARVIRGGRTVAKLHPGDFFGEMALLDDGPRTADVYAETELTTLGITSWDFKALLKRRPTIALGLLVHLTGRLRESQKREDRLRA